jgi:hypothetical protein
MGFLYSASFTATAVTAAVDIFELTATADKPIVLHKFVCSQTTDLGDSAEEVLNIGIYRGASAGSGGSSSTELAYTNSDEPSVSVVSNHVVTTPSTGGSLLEVIPWNIRVPCIWLPPPEHRPRIDSSEDPVVFRFVAAPTDSITMSATVIWEEN